MTNIQALCKKCSGKCCKGIILLTDADVQKLKLAGRKFKTRAVGALYLMDHKGKCFFLGKNGCNLDEKLKPDDCVLFPIVFTYKNKKVKFYLHKKCPYFNEIPEEWINGTKEWARKQIGTWSEKEKKSYSNTIESFPASRLVPI